MRRVPERQLTLHWSELVLTLNGYFLDGALRRGALEQLFETGSLPSGAAIYGAEYIEQIDWRDFVAPGYPE